MIETEDLFDDTGKDLFKVGFIVGLENLYYRIKYQGVKLEDYLDGMMEVYSPLLKDAVRKRLLDLYGGQL